MRTITIYRDDSTVQVRYGDVKTYFWTAGNTVLTVARFIDAGPEHYYVHWLRERFCWFKEEPPTLKHDASPCSGDPVD